MTNHEPTLWSLPAERTSAAASWHPRRCAIAAATVVVVGTAPLFAHAAIDDSANAATRRLIDAQLSNAASSGPAALASTTVMAGDAALPEPPAAALLVAQQPVPPADAPATAAPAPAQMPAAEAAPAPSPTVILPPGVPSPDCLLYTSDAADEFRTV